MKISKRLALLLILSTLLSITLVGCTRSSNLNSYMKNGPTTTVVDCVGRSVEVPEKVERIGCLYAFSGQVVTMLGRGPSIVAVVDGLKRDKLLIELVPGIKQASTPVTSSEINIEELIKSNPDVVFVQKASIGSKGSKEKLEKSGIPFLVIDFNSIKEQQYAIEVIGKAIGASEKAKRYNEYYQTCIEHVKTRVDDLPDKERIKVYHSVNEATRTDTKDTLPADWMKVTGVINVSVNEELKLIEDKYYASLEQIYLWDPDVIIVNEMGVADYIMKNKQWDSLRAVKDKKVYQIPNGISRWGHPGSLETPLGILWTAKTVYPERFKDLNISEETKKYYKEFFNINLTDKLVSQILMGKGMRIPKGEKN